MTTMGLNSNKMYCQKSDTQSDNSTVTSDKKSPRSSGVTFLFLFALILQSLVQGKHIKGFLQNANSFKSVGYLYSLDFIGERIYGNIRNRFKK